MHEKVGNSMEEWGGLHSYAGGCVGAMGMKHTRHSVQSASSQHFHCLHHRGYGTPLSDQSPFLMAKRVPQFQTCLKKPRFKAHLSTQARCNSQANHSMPCQFSVAGAASLLSTCVPSAGAASALHSKPGPCCGSLPNPPAV